MEPGRTFSPVLCSLHPLSRVFMILKFCRATSFRMVLKGTTERAALSVGAHTSLPMCVCVSVC